MLKRSAIRTVSVWIALCAILLNAFAPSFTHAVQALSSAPGSWEICSSGNVGQAAVSGAIAKFSLAPAPAKSGAMKHCPYCGPGLAAVLPAPTLNLALSGRLGERPFLFYRAPKPLLALSAAAPRGPPVLA